MDALTLGPSDLFLPNANLEGRPVQLPLFPDLQRWNPWVIRLHHATTLHYDLRFEHRGALISFVLAEPPSLNPDRWVVTKRMADHDPKHMMSERRIPKGSVGAGPTMPVDTGLYAPIFRQYRIHEEEIAFQLAEGDLRMQLTGTYLQGAWRLWAKRGQWRFQKLPDEYASKTTLLTLDRSIRTGKSLSDLK